MLNGASVPTILVDRYIFRELLDSANGPEIWPTGRVAVLSIDFAKQPDVLDSLVRCHWDVVCVDEWQLFSGMRAESLRRIAATAGRFVLASATKSGADPSEVAAPENMTVVDWGPLDDRIVDHEGNWVSGVPLRLSHDVSYTPNEMELKLRNTVRELCELFRDDAGVTGWQAKLLLRCLESSPGALERTLERLAERQTLPNTVDEERRLMGEPNDEATMGPSGMRDSGKITEVAERALHEIEAIANDSKLSAFGELIAGFNEQKAPPRQIVVLAEFTPTLFYLAANVEERGMKCLLLHGGMEFEQRMRSLELFSAGCGILVATSATAGNGIDLPRTTDLILYDAPGSDKELEQVLRRFERFGEWLNVYTFSHPSFRAKAGQPKIGIDKGAHT
jgi:hypothetical protein